MLSDFAPEGLVDIFDDASKDAYRWVGEKTGSQLDERVRLLRPFHHMMVVANMPPEVVSEGGIHIPDTSQQRTGLVFPIIIGSRMGTGEYGRYSPYWEDKSYEVPDLREMQRDFLGRCFIVGLNAIRELQVTSRDLPGRCRYGLIHSADPTAWCEYAEYSMQYNNASSTAG